MLTTTERIIKLIYKNPEKCKTVKQVQNMAYSAHVVTLDDKLFSAF